MTNITETQEVLNVPETGLLDNTTITAGVMFIIFALAALFVVTLSLRTSKTEA